MIKSIHITFQTNSELYSICSFLILCYTLFTLFSRPLIIVVALKCFKSTTDSNLNGCQNKSTPRKPSGSHWSVLSLLRLLLISLEEPLNMCLIMHDLMAY